MQLLFMRWLSCIAHVTCLHMHASLTNTEINILVCEHNFQYLFIWFCVPESHLVCKPAHLVPERSQDKLGGLCHEGHPA